MSLVSLLRDLFSQLRASSPPFPESPSALPWVDSPPDFDIAFKRLFDFEGGLSNHPADRGGLTKYGITHMTWSWYHGGNPPYPITEATESDARALYFDVYWLRPGLPELRGYVPAALLHEVFDSCVNHGVNRGIRFLQSAYNVVRLPSSPDLVGDGVSGPLTRSSLRDFCIRPEYGESLHAAFRGVRYEFYQSIIRNDPSQRAFVRGWLRRLL